MSFSQCPDQLSTLFNSIHLEGFCIRGVYVGKIGNYSKYPFSTKPRKADGYINSTCWRGYIAHFELEESGRLTLRKYVALDKVEQRVDQMLTGGFWLDLEGLGNLGTEGRIQVPFENGKIIQDTLTWKGEPELLAWVRMSSHRHTDWPVVGEIKWFGGTNGKTGHVNNYGFITASGDEFYFQRSKTRAPLESLTGGAQVVFQRIIGENGKLAAEKVRVLSQLSDEELTALIKAPERLTPQDMLAVALQRRVIPPPDSVASSATSQ